MKKLNKLVAILVALAMMMALAVTSAFAVDHSDNKEGKPLKNGTYEDQPNLAIQKVLNLAEGIAIPSTGYTFNVSLVTTDSEAAKAAPDSTFDDYNKTLTATGLIRATDENNAEETYATAVTQDLFSSEQPNFTKAGTYYFKVNEAIPFTAGTAQDGTVTEVGTPDAKGIVTVTITKGKKVETYKFDTSDKYIVVGVAATIVNGETKYYVDSIAVKNDEGKIEIKEVKRSVTDPDTQETTTEDAYAFDVNNSYAVIDSDLLKIGKTIEGKEVDGVIPEANTKWDDKKTFNFHVTVVKPDTSDKTTYTYKLYKGEDDTAPVAKTITLNDAGSASFDVALADGWYILFDDMDAGASYTVTEDDYSEIGYETKEGTTFTDAKLVSASKSASIVTNIYDSTKDNTQTGLTLNNLPFIVLALVAIGGLVAYVVVRRRNADEA